jgi:hypothetical protein
LQYNYVNSTSRSTLPTPQSDTVLVYLTEDSIHGYTLSFLVDGVDDSTGGNLSVAIQMGGVADGYFLVQDDPNAQGDT